MMLLDPPLAREALEFGASLAGLMTLFAFGVVAPLLCGAALFALALLWGVR